MMQKYYPIIAALACAVIIGLAGTEERADQYCRDHINQTAYTEIISKLGRYSSSTAIKAEYLKHKDYYDAKEETWDD